MVKHQTHRRASGTVSKPNPKLPPARKTLLAESESAAPAFPRKTRLRIFVMESPDPMDLLQGRSEAQSLQSACALIGHEVATMLVRSKDELATACEYVSSMDSKHDHTQRPTLPLCVHVSAHGNTDGIGIGRDLLTWKELFLTIKPLCHKLPAYAGKVVIVLSACCLSDQQLTKAIQAAQRSDRKLAPPAYLFTTAEESLAWPDALVSWLLFYHKLPNVCLDEREAVQEVLRKVKEAGAATLLYHRWDVGKDQYRRFWPRDDPKG